MHGRGCEWQREQAWQGASVAGGHAWQEACVAGETCVAGGHAWHTVNEWAVCILLECILVSCLKYTVNLYFHLFRRKSLPMNDFELTVSDLYIYMEENGLAAMLATKRSPSVTPEVNLSRTCNMYASFRHGFETQRRHHKKSKTVVSVA